MPSNSRWTQVADTVRTRLWPVPLIGVFVAAAAGLALPELDRALVNSLPARLQQYVFGGGPAEAREVLGTIASSLTTVTSQ